MNLIKSITLLGTMEACNKGRCLLENHPAVRRIDVNGNDMQVKMLLKYDIPDLAILSMLEKSGLDGVLFEFGG